MANNPYVNKVEYGGNTIMDLTGDSVAPENLLSGETAHDRSGAQITGTAKQGHVVQNPSGTDMTQRAKLQFLDAGVSDDSTNQKTKIENVQVISAESELASKPDGMYLGSYEEDLNGILDASMVAYGDGTVETAFNGVELSYTSSQNVTVTDSRTHILRFGKLVYISVWLQTSSAMNNVLTLDGFTETDWKYEYVIMNVQTLSNSFYPVWARFTKWGSTLQIYNMSNGAANAGTYFINGFAVLA